MQLGLGLGLPHLNNSLASVIAQFIPTGASTENVLVADNPTGTFVANGASGSFSDVFSHTRAGNATYLDSAGVIQTAGVDAPRTQHYVPDGSGGWAGPVCLIEPEATNLLFYSEGSGTASAPSFWSWLGSGSGEVAATLSNGLGGYTLSGGNRYLRNAQTLAAGTYTASVYVEPGATYAGAVIKMNGFVGITGVTSATAADADEDGRVRITFTVDAGDTGGEIQIGQVVAGTGEVTFGGWQLESGYNATSYVQTAGAQVTRAADSLSIAAATCPDPASGSHHVFVTYADTGTAAEQTIFDRRVDANNRITLTLDTDGAKTGTFTLTMVNGGSSASTSHSTEITPGVSVEAHVAWRVTSSEIQIALNGVSETATSTAIGIPDLSSADADFDGITGSRMTDVLSPEDWGATGIAEITT